MIMYLLMMLTAAAVSYAATWGARLVGNRLEVFSPIRSRDMHSTPISRLGGLGIFVGALVALVVASQSFFVKDIFRGNDSPWGVLAGAAVIVVVGLADDLVDLRWWVKLIGQGVAGTVVAVWGVRVSIVPFIPEPIVIENEGASIVLTAGLIVVTMNAFNFIDGLDGLAAGVAIIGGAAFFLTAYWVHRTADILDRSDLATLLTAIVVGSCLGFLPHNWFPAKIFMGDSGAMLIGLLLASAGIVSTGQITSGLYDRVNGIPTIIPILLPFAVLFLPILDLCLAVVRRTAVGRSPWSADRGHLHHKLLDIGYSHRSAVVLMYLWTCVLAFGGLAFVVYPWQIVLAVDLAATAIMAVVTAWPYLHNKAPGRGPRSAAEVE
ncbi:UDP-GlcNAc:undecaprenyl-phosphate GlcNAc-1-phosphate transferase [Arthrobacter sp. V4I6]|uniref:MraY family glycosyltransferase n=1 Tax=unclassified Arthrobacter TaxID=235627 RepID=UPI0027821631|nr:MULTISPECIES: MraY family glycosyltransferase [unclassified Arthrobacter]MDQ0820300.1 UDP-GlcNAc:undecaprenyl-phosphate GlcNAc-1-phosphate transferase [Arthrobacter sp. V1I7]MDQ0854482.1 UDP-GlcNAc:undecaprenyl-phosphate GlcNAc-1-phosphate transferase [Arthrobacter sp. V4I6]